MYCCSVQGRGHADDAGAGINAHPVLPGMKDIQNHIHELVRYIFDWETREVRAKIQQAIGPHEDLPTIVKRRKLQWYGRVFRSSGLAKTILQDTVKGGRRQGRQKKRWEDNIRE